jgi:hypothetical protein
MKTINLKYSFITFLLFLMMLQYSKAVKPGEDVIKEIVTAIQSMDAKKLTGYFSAKVDLDVSDINGNYSKTQAEIIMRDFFKNNPVISFTLNHEGESDDGSQFFIGTYKTAAKNYRVYTLLKKESDRLLIQQLQFDEE